MCLLMTILSSAIVCGEVFVAVTQRLNNSTTQQLSDSATQQLTALTTFAIVLMSNAD